MEITKHPSSFLDASVYRLVMNAFGKSHFCTRESLFLLKMLFVQKRNSARRKRIYSSGLHVPPFLIASVSARCNLFCNGCYARANHSCCDSAEAELPAKEWSRYFHEAAGLGISFCLLAGGEPLMRTDVLTAAASVRDMIFPVFTNGTLLCEDILRHFERNRNLVPILSLEGLRDETDRRRGEGTFDKVSAAMMRLRQSSIFYGVSLTFTLRNLSELTGEELMRFLSDSGCRVVFYVEYVPAGSDHSEAPGEQERAFLEQRLAELRKCHLGMLFLSFPGDEKATGGCLAAGRGFFHINASGCAEPCPFSPVSDTNLKGLPLTEALRSPLFQKLTGSDFLNLPHEGGCALFGRDGELRELIKKE